MQPPTGPYVYGVNERSGLFFSINQRLTIRPFVRRDLSPSQMV